MDAALAYEIRRGDFAVSCDPARLDVDYLFAFLSNAYWYKALSRDRLERALDHSLNFGLYHLADRGRQVGFVRLVGDRTTFAYLADVFVDAAFGGAGLGQWLMAAVHGHPELQGLKRWVLKTRDAHRFYERFGYGMVGGESGFMEWMP